jgi:hypothetical protein
MDMNRGSYVVLAMAFALAGCGGASDKAALDKIDGKLSGKGDADPALTAALEDQIMVDPSLSGQANDDAIKPASEPNQTPVPQSEGTKSTPAGQTLGGLAAEQAEIAKESFNGCELTVQYSMDFASRLPADLPLYPQSQVSEAAGSDTGGCHLRAISHNSNGTLKQVAQHYAGTATRAGYTVASKAEASGMMVSGKRAADGGAFYALLTPNGAGTSVDLVVNNGQ